MLNSMTGYGRGEAKLHAHTIVVEMRSVNNRYLDCNVRLPRVYACAEEAIQSEIKQCVSRGKVDVNRYVADGIFRRDGGDLSPPQRYFYLPALLFPGCVPGGKGL